MDELFLELQSALAGEYSIERELGRGGMGIVYLARQVRLARERFLRGARTAARHHSGPIDE